MGLLPGNFDYGQADVRIDPTKHRVLAHHACAYALSHHLSLEETAELVAMLGYAAQD